MEAWGRTLARTSLVISALLALSGCMSSLGVASSGLMQCQQVNQEALKFVNWAKVPEIDVKIRHEEFTPMIIRLRQGWPYVIRIRNNDAQAHAFNAHDFFSNVAVVSAAINDEEEEDTCFRAVWIPPRGSVKLKLVAVIDGRYEFDSTMPLIPNIFPWGPSGVIVVEERRPRI